MIPSSRKLRYKTYCPWNIKFDLYYQRKYFHSKAVKKVEKENKNILLT